jgi:hypothetical protein
MGDCRVDVRIWRIVDSGLGTYLDVALRWTVRELLDAHEYLDLKADLEAVAREAAERKGATK